MQSACCFCICSTHVQFNKLNDMKYEISCCFCFVQHNTKDTGTCYWMILINKCYWRSIFFTTFTFTFLAFRCVVFIATRSELCAVALSSYGAMATYLHLPADLRTLLACSRPRLMLSCKSECASAADWLLSRERLRRCWMVVWSAGSTWEEHAVRTVWLMMQRGRCTGQVELRVPLSPECSKWSADSSGSP